MGLTLRQISCTILCGCTDYQCSDCYGKHQKKCEVEPESGKVLRKDKGYKGWMDIEFHDCGCYP